MRVRTMWLAFVAMLLTASFVVAQESPAVVEALEFQKPKSGMTRPYEAGRKQKAAWHKQQNDSQGLFVWEIRSGLNTGTYIVGRLGQHWADFDKPSLPDQADLEEYEKVVGANVESIVTRYYEFLPKLSNMGNSKPTDKFAEVLSFQVMYGKSPEFRGILARITEAAQKTKWPPEFLWYYLASGGETGTYVLVLPHKSWADFADKPDTKPFRGMLTEAYGPVEAESIISRINHCVKSEMSEIIEFRADLSYLPAK